MNARTLIGLFFASAAALSVMAGPALRPTAVEAAPVCSPDLAQLTPQDVSADFRGAADWTAWVQPRRRGGRVVYTGAPGRVSQSAGLLRQVSQLARSCDFGETCADDLRRLQIELLGML